MLGNWLLLSCIPSLLAFFNERAGDMATSQETALVDPTLDPTCPFKINCSPELGRYLVAARDLQKGELILEDRPLVTGPQRGSPPICLSCYGPVEIEDLHECGWPMCSQECCDSLNHTPECQMARITGRQVVIDNEEPENINYECVIFLRCLYLKGSEPEKWSHILNMEGHMDKRRYSDLFAHTELLIFILRTVFGITEEDFPENELHLIGAVLDVNSYEIRMPTYNVQGLYPYASLPEHNCVANTHRSFNLDHTLVLRAATQIKKGEHIKVNYTDPMWTTKDRRADLLYSKFFDCKCERCKDPTELGSFMGAVHCPLCSAATLTPSNNNQTEWKCSECQEMIPGQYGTKLVKDCSQSLQELEDDEAAEDPLAFEAYLERFSGLIHPNHAHLTDAKYTLLHLYGTADGYAMDEMSPETLARKEELCRELILICDKIMPGISRFRGTIVYELAKALIQRAQNEEQKENPKKEVLKAIIDEAKKALSDTINILQYEPEYQPEGELVKQAKDNLKHFEEWSQSLG